MITILMLEVSKARVKMDRASQDVLQAWAEALNLAKTPCWKMKLKKLLHLDRMFLECFHLLLCVCLIVYY